jgi:hypothetical protein
MASRLKRRDWFPLDHARICDDPEWEDTQMNAWFNPRNWRGETRNQELERRVKALEASVQSTHDRINEVDERLNAAERKLKFSAGGL